MWALDGFTKQKNKLANQDISRGDSVAEAWRSTRSSNDELADRRKTKQQTRKKGRRR